MPFVLITGARFRPAQELDEQAPPGVLSWECATAKGDAMAKIIENAPQRMVLQSGSTTFTLDKGANTAVMQRKLLFWSLKPLEVPLTDVAEITLDVGVDRASGVEICNTMVVMRTGAAWALPADDRKDAETTATAMRGFLELG
jgi:hypothetical protein